MHFTQHTVFRHSTASARVYTRILNKKYAAYVRTEIYYSKGLFLHECATLMSWTCTTKLISYSASDRSFARFVSNTHSIQDGALHVVGRTAIVYFPTLASTPSRYWEHPLDMPITITTLLAIVVALCVQDTVAVTLAAINTHNRRPWGENDVLLTCSSEVGTLVTQDAVFTRNQEPITISGPNDGCTPGGDTYCYANNGQRLSFVANCVTEGKYACEYMNITSNELAIVGKCILHYFAVQTYIHTLYLGFAVINVLFSV